MSTISLNDIQVDLLGCLKRVASGETLMIVDQDRAIAELRPVSTLLPARRPAGLYAGEFRVPDDFNDPLPEEILSQFDGR